MEEFARAAFDVVDLPWEEYVRTVPELTRPAEVWSLCGDYSKIHKELGWWPEIAFSYLVEEMVLSDLQRYSSSPKSILAGGAVGAL